MLKLFHAALAILVLGALPADAAEVPILRIYTYDSFASEYGPGPALKAGFEKTCGCVVEFTAVDSAISALRRIQLEGETTEADILLGIDTDLQGEALATGLFVPHGVDLKGVSLPMTSSGRDFVPYDYGFLAFVYDKDVVAHPPSSFEQLIAMPDDFKIVIEDPRSDTPGLGLVLWIRHEYKDRAPEIWRGLKPHILTVTRGWSEAYALFLNGEADMVLSYTTSPAYHAIVEGDDSYAYADFGAHYSQVELAGILKSSQKQELARAFLAYLVSPEAQKIIPTTNWMYPVRDIGDALPPEFAALKRPGGMYLLRTQDIAPNKDAWIEEALAAIQ